MAQAEPTWRFHLIDRHLCLNFANTLSWRFSGRAIDHMASYTDLLSFTEQAALLPVEECRHLTHRAARHRAEASRVAEHARELRETLYRTFRGIVDQGMPQPDDVAAINHALASAMARWRLEGMAPPYKLVWGGPDALDPMLGPVLKSAAELLASDELTFLRTCGNPKCGWLFVDTSRNRLRRWCDMRVCGNRGKAARFHERHRAP